MTTYKSVGHSAQLHSALWGVGVILIVYVVLIVIIVEQANAMSTSTIQYIMRP
jgi:hypothetical protein